MAIFDLTLAELRRRTSMKWRRYGPDVLPAWVAEMDCRPAPAVRETLVAAIESGDTGYPEGSDYQAAYADFAATRWGWDFDPGDAVIVPDVMQGVAKVAELLTPPDTAVVVNNPVYNCFYGYLPWAKRRVLEVPLGADGRLDLDALAAAFAGPERPSAYLLCNPHNPTGTVHSPAELTRVAELAAEHGVAVISDEIHAPLVPADAGFVPYLSLPGTEDAVTVTSASKAWNLAGLKAAVAIGGTRAAAALRTLPNEVTGSASHLGILSHVAALEKARDWLDEAIDEIAANRALFSELLARDVPGAVYRPGAATYLAWVDARRLGLDRPVQQFRTRGQVALSDGAAFGSGGEGFVRVNLATSPEILTEVVARMGRAVAPA